MAVNTEPTVNDALDALVSQFSSTLDFYRELIQNSIDAGSHRVDVWTQYIPATVGKGTIAIHVDDYGEGMDDTIIDNELTKLFASSKENDLTKIGKFGIGFVSIFALRPKAVLLHTGRGGEYWEVMFHEDRSYSKAPLDEPIEGTQITLFVEGDRHRYDELIIGTRRTLKRWCAHSETEIYFSDRDAPGGEHWEKINEPFEVPGEVMTRVSHQGTEIVLAYSRKPRYGFFNKGLTLLETNDGEEALGARARRFGYIGVKIKSRYLEHTLSRETILKDQNYHKALVLLQEAADTELFGKLVGQLEEIARQPRLSVQVTESYMRLLGFLAKEPHERLLSIGDSMVLRTVSGRAASLEEMRLSQQRDGRVFICAERSTVADMLEEQGTLVLLGNNPFGQYLIDTDESVTFRAMRGLALEYLVAHDHSTFKSKAERTAGNVLSLVLRQSGATALFDRDMHARFSSRINDPEDVYLAVEIDDRLPAKGKDLVRHAEELLREVNAGHKRLRTCRLQAAAYDPPLFVVGRRFAELMARPPSAASYSEGGTSLVVGINREHPQYVALVKLYAKRPDFAVYCLAKNLLLVEDRLLNLDMGLVSAVMKRTRLLGRA